MTCTAFLCQHHHNHHHHHYNTIYCWKYILPHKIFVGCKKHNLVAIINIGLTCFWKSKWLAQDGELGLDDTLCGVHCTHCAQKQRRYVWKQRNKGGGCMRCVVEVVNQQRVRLGSTSLSLWGVILFFAYSIFIQFILIFTTLPYAYLFHTSLVVQFRGWLCTMFTSNNL